ncbi:hypothetical protein FKM82_000041 [Ascaphus truei]
MDEKTTCSMPSYTEKITLGIIKILESSPGIAEVKFESKPPAERHMIVSWEQKNTCTLPEDLKNFYLMTDGFQMTWNVKLDGIEGPSVKPHFDSRNVIFELDPCNGNGKVCLVYKTSKPGVATLDAEIWFLDRALFWHFLTPTFTSYYRLLICHLGLPQWHYAFTSYGLSPQAKQWFNMYKPITFNTALLSEEAESMVNKLDPNKIFKSKNKTPLTKKKLPAPPAGPPKGHPASAKSTSHSANITRK